MGVTENFEIPYPDPSDLVDLPQDLRNMAERIDAVVGLATIGPVGPPGAGSTGAFEITNISGNYTPVLTDIGKLVSHDSVSAHNITLPTHADVAYIKGATITFVDISTGVLTVIGDDGVIVISRGDAFTSAGKGAIWSATQVEFDLWVVAGDLVT